MTVATLALVFTVMPAQANALGNGLSQQLAQGGRTLLQASAFGTEASIGHVIISSRTAPASLPGCGTFDPPAHAGNTIATVDAPPLFKTGTITTTADGSVDADGTLRAVGTADIQSVNMLSDLITADALKLVSTTTRDTAGFHTSTEGSEWVNLRVAGNSIGTPGVNQRIDLPGIGYLVINEQILDQRAKRTTFTVNLLHVVVTQQNSYAPVGAGLILGSATSGVVEGLNGALSGFAWGTYAAVNGRPATILSGPTASVVLGCSGTKGHTITHSVGQVLLENVFDVGGITNTAWGQTAKSGVRGETTSTVTALNLAEGLVTADTIKADAHATHDNTTGKTTLSDDGTQFVNLSITGFPEIGDDVPLNTKLDIAGLGTLWLRHTYATANELAIVAVELVVTEENSLGIPIGADILIGVADVGAF